MQSTDIRINMTEHSIEDSLPRGILATKLRKKLTKLQFWEAMDKTIIIESLHKSSDYYQLQLDLSTKLWNQHQQLHPKVAESENIGANHLGFAKSLFQYYCQHLGLNHNHISAESAFNFYVNERITYLLGTSVNTELAKETFYSKLIQNTSLPTNYNFASIITEINKEIEHHIQQRYSITYASKGKRKLQTPAITPKRIQPSTWKKTKIESPTAPSYYYTPGSAINITLASVSTSNMISTFRQFSFQNFGTTTLWELSEEEKEEKSEDQEFTYQNPILENPEFGTPNHHKIKTPNRTNWPAHPNTEPTKSTTTPSTASTITTTSTTATTKMAYAPIVKLDKFTGKKDNAQVWLNDNTADSWYQSLIDKPQNFNAFKLEFLKYFSNNNSINRLANTFTTIKQGETEAVTTYLERFYRNLQQIQAIDVNYFTAPQILNQFICGLCSSILQHVCPLYPTTLQDAVTHARNFESAKLEANHAHAMNLMMNGSSELDSKLKQSKDAQTNKLEFNQQQPLTSNIPPTTITNDKLLTAIFPFKLEESSNTPLFSSAALEEKLITAMYTDAKVDKHTIKLILDSGLAGSIITQQLMDQLDHRVD
ncbi:hypothetical protein G9A89_010274 [Geosiphon pyriformis]|nr:hypothetical protein G9A89_010274 [Geosiphon pyriformis]